MLTPEQIKACMNVVPFVDDCVVKNISDKIVVARKDATCCICFQYAPKNTHHRVQTAIVDGDFRSCRICDICCAALCKDDDTEIIERSCLGRRTCEASA